jgi:hypothetical protein
MAVRYKKICAANERMRSNIIKEIEGEIKRIFKYVMRQMMRLVNKTPGQCGPITATTGGILDEEEDN